MGNGMREKGEREKGKGKRETGRGKRTGIHARNRTEGRRSSFSLFPQ
jgi:hypothetical protein